MLLDRQQWTLEQKIDHTIGTIESFVQFATNQGKTAYISFSGGKDSTVLLDIARRFVDKNFKAVFCNTGNEYPETVRFVRGVDNVEIVRPKLKVWEVIAKYGFPLINKEQAQFIYEAKTTKSKKVYDLRMNGTPGSVLGRISAKWKVLVDKPYLISHFCCKKLKKEPLRTWEKHNNALPILGVMASESNMRAMQYVRRGGCNAFSSKHPASYPLSIWTDQDIWDYIHKFHVPYSPIYDKGLTQTGCMFCGFGCQYDDDRRFEILKSLYPKFYEMCMLYTNNGTTYAEAIKDVRQINK